MKILTDIISKFIILLYFALFTIILLLFSIYGLIYGRHTDKSNYWSIICSIGGFSFGLISSVIINNKDKKLSSSS